MTTKHPIIIEKTRELCQCILDQAEYHTIRRQVDAFLGDSESQSQYQRILELGEQLHQKQHSGQSLSGQETNEFEQERAALMKNPVAKGFLEAQEAMHEVQSSINQYVAKTFELGRVPQTEDFPSDSCGPDCGCGH